MYIHCPSMRQMCVCVRARVYTYTYMLFVCAESSNAHAKKQKYTQVYIEHSALYYNAFALYVLTETPRIRVHNTMILGDHVWGR